MDSDISSGGFTNRTTGSHNGSSFNSNFAFTFNDSNFFDRVLRIVIVPDLTDSNSDSDGCTTVADSIHNRKHRREDNIKENGMLVLGVIYQAVISGCLVTVVMTSIVEFEF
ncbi:hypothetical protein ACH5RR_023940 [Cinchona calisaya]|uniref:Uncharacterized protein n=1 Tax=Cinchona calisaya TaxID=153742 RepID=A0ABD2ZH46_9GENT